MKTSFNTIVIGGGQAGLSLSYHLSQQGVEHLVLERARVGERWRTERWDSLRFQFPNRYVRLPGFDYDGDNPNDFMGSDGIVGVLERYANHIAAPIRCGVNVRSVERAVERKADAGFVVKTDEVEFQAANVVLATGPYQRTLVPAISAQLPVHIVQLTASSYTQPGTLPQGAVLVVGSGGSGVQIAEDLIDAGRETYLCVGAHKRVPRRYKGRDIMDWWEEIGMTREPVEDRPVGDHAPLLTGVSGGADVDLRALANKGGHLLGRLEGVEDGALDVGNNLLNDIAIGDEAYDLTVGMIEEHLAQGGGSETSPRPMPTAPPLSVDIQTAGISSVIWATGYGLDFSWVHCGEVDENGVPSHDRGVSPDAGLYYLGLPFLHSARSSFFWGVGDDASFIAEHLVSRGQGL
ncbi:MAG: putative flavoprotein involved in K+ transport [Limisphaerales bacterium]